jgi:hypothetical protein
MRYPLEIIETVAGRPADKPLSVRISSVDGAEGVVADQIAAIEARRGAPTDRFLRRLLVATAA